MFGLHFRDDGESLIPNLPTVFFARSLYAWITLVRVAAVGNTVCDEGSLRIEEYLERLGQVLDEAASMQHFHTAMSIPPIPLKPRLLAGKDVNGRILLDFTDIEAML